MVLLGLMLIGLVLETLSIGLVIPVSVLMMQNDIDARYPTISPVLNWLGNPSQQALIVGAMVGLISIYLLKNLFLGFLAWRETRFAFDAQAQLSQSAAIDVSARARRQGIIVPPCGSVPRFRKKRPPTRPSPVTTGTARSGSTAIPSEFQ